MKMEFRVSSDYQPTGDQPEAIRQLAEGLINGEKFQVLLGVTGSGKTFTMANVIEKVQRPTLILSHNKTLAAQLYGEMKQFFPDNSVEYFVSYYDYYQPEAYIPTTNTYIEKDLSINKDIEKLRLSTTSSLLSGRRDVIVVSSVSCLYGIGNPEDFHANVITLSKGEKVSRNSLLHRLVDALYSRSDVDFQRGNFRVKGDTVDIFPAYADVACRIIFWGEEVEEISSLDPVSGMEIQPMDQAVIYPANIFVTTRERMHNAIRLIQDDLVKQIDFFQENGKPLEAKRIQERVEYDLEMIRELGYCPGIENYSRYFDGRTPGTRPFCLLDYFPSDFLTIIDESHVTLPQIRAMFGGDRSRKVTLVEFGFRLPAAIDNRPLRFEEFESLVNQIIYVSATPADYELERTEGVVVEQLIRPTGLLDPMIEIRPARNQIDDLMHEISLRAEKNERTLVTTLTKRMAEELTRYLSENGFKSRYIHSDVDTLERVEIMEQLRKGVFDVLVGINLLREGLDLPEVSLVAILDADKEGFLRSERSLTQTAGRAARNLNGRVIMYASSVTASMQKTMDATNYRREKQLKYNLENNITPRQIVKPTREIIGYAYRSDKQDETGYSGGEVHIDVAADPVVQFMSPEALEKSITATKKLMQEAARQLDFIEAARLRDEMFRLRELLAEKKSRH
ncbi:MAG: excinuclease ABC subunit UvrB [Prolixibacteraceae bacterium]|jgi:excinuclease ABC subunit B|nr:excinuclease ABC subunit UvrB [Prolixibacteraceae bacterium]NLS99107.1 excinuclease ABC subunit UvrB [Bacteroidales bacterium]HNZ69264.1 excinuclease ABC subunit UvrB [Prolixibacteraceae bacterium]HOC85516.1 excinuclease ABC subunit UvrB [Prolixibacteraceae bacterium]HOG96100.1 excinuclease ABC subunit UvrB [Prolixibacteraceae bacterium]